MRASCYQGTSNEKEATETKSLQRIENIRKENLVKEVQPASDPKLCKDRQTAKRKVMKAMESM